MFPLLLPFITDTVIAPPADYTDIFVNEWGVVIYDTSGLYLAGAPTETGYIEAGRQPYGLELLVDAPVVWLHGATFDSATFTVKAKSGELTTLFPEPSVNLENRVASWEISAPLQSNPDQQRPDLVIPPGTPFAWAMDYWRKVPSLDMFSSEDHNYLANFLYYEASVSNWIPPDGIYDGKILAGFYAPEGLLITTGSIPTVERIQLIPLPDGSEIPSEMAGHLSDDQIADILCGWAGGNLKSQEIESIWQTWSPFFTVELADEITCGTDFRNSDEKWILFPLPWDVVEEISTIHLKVHDSVDRIITYNRLFLGLVRIN